MVTYRTVRIAAWYSYASGYRNIRPHRRRNGIRNMMQALAYLVDSDACPRLITACVAAEMLCRIVTGTVPDRPPVE